MDKSSNVGLLNKIEDLIGEYNKDSLICYIVTEYDCNLCIESIYRWHEDVKKYPQLTQSGIIYVKNKDEIIDSVVVRLNLPDDINWHITSEVSLFELLAEKFPAVKSPRAVGVFNGKITFVKSINIESF